MDRLERLYLKNCKYNNLQGVNRCLSRGVDVNTRYQYTGTGLMLACESGHPAIVSRLVQVPGLDINYQEAKEGWTAALQAIDNGHTECVRLLAETGRVDWNKADVWGRTSLYTSL